MLTSGVQELNAAASNFLNLRDSSYIVEESYTNILPFETLFIGGFPDKRTSSYKMYINLSSLVPSKMSPQDISLYLFKELTLLTDLNTPHTANNASTKVAQRDNYDQIDAWVKAIQAHEGLLDEKLIDPYLIKLVASYQDGNQVKFQDCASQAR